jgi:UDP-GlcNAc3NAcA epimerase
MRIVTVVGARPQFIKSAPVSRVFQDSGIEEYVIHTGQHYDPGMSAVFFDEMNLPKPYVTLHAGQLSRVAMIEKIQSELLPILNSIRPDYVLVYGDTNSTLAGSRAAHALKIPIIHVEAGLRSYNLSMPEELNRIETDKLSSWLFVPSKVAADNLINEGFASDRIIEVGDVMRDAMSIFAPKSRYTPSLGNESWFQSPFILATLHRQENTQSLKQLKERINQINALHKDVLPVWMPIHPATAKRLEEFGLEFRCNTSKPASYFEMLWALKECAMVVTDSGGLQKEAFWAQKPCITLRDETEWSELVSIGANVLVPSNSELEVTKVASTMLQKEIDFTQQPYGSIGAAKKIVDSILEG